MILSAAIGSADEKISLAKETLLVQFGFSLSREEGVFATHEVYITASGKVVLRQFHPKSIVVKTLTEEEINEFLEKLDIIDFPGDAKPPDFMQSGPPRIRIEIKAKGRVKSLAHNVEKTSTYKEALKLTVEFLRKIECLTENNEVKARE